MKRSLVALALVLSSPALLFAQQPKSAADDPTSATPAVTNPDDLVTPVTTPAPSANTALPTSLSTQNQQSRAAQKPKPTKPSPSSDERPPIEGSMVGYIDNAVIGNQFRIRFDAGFDDNRPDRAEFFYAKCGCNGGDSQGPQPGLATHINFQQLYLRSEFAPSRHFSFFAEVPFRWVQPQQFVPQTIPNGGFTNKGGLSDIQAGIKLAPIASSHRYLTLQLTGFFPSGSSREALGTHHYSLQTSVLYMQRVTDRLSFEGELGVWHGFDGDSPGFTGNVFQYGLGPSYELYRGETVRFAPVVELVGWSVLSGKESDGTLVAHQIAIGAPVTPIVNSDGTQIVNLKVGARTTVGRHNSFYFGYGQALTHEMWYKHIIRLEYRYSF